MKIKAAILFCLFLSVQCIRAEEPEKTAEIQWMNLEEALALNSKTPKKIFIDVYTHWCGWCKRMDATTFKDPEVAAYMNEHFYAVKLDAETKDTLHYKGTDYAFRPDYKSNELAAIFLNGQMGYPSYVYLDEQSNLIGPVPGYLSKEQMIPVLKYFAENFYKTTNWEAYMKENIK